MLGTLLIALFCRAGNALRCLCEASENVLHGAVESYHVSLQAGQYYTNSIPWDQGRKNCCMMAQFLVDRPFCSWSNAYLLLVTGSACFVKLLRCR